MTNQLYFGDNLEVLRESIKDESVDLIYLDPPFNSNATYNVLFKSPKGYDSDAQIEAFDDTRLAHNLSC
jgi:site-specific DNA-methyltransferase (adenine-specific)